METLQSRFEEDKTTAAAIYGQEGQQQNTMTSIDVVSRKRQRKPEDPGSLGTIHSQQHNAEISKTTLEKLQMKLQTYVTYIYYSSYQYLVTHYKSNSEYIDGHTSLQLVVDPHSSNCSEAK